MTFSISSLIDAQIVFGKSYKPKKNYALVIGAEQYGISKIWKDNASQVLKIDTENKVDSLNASGAAAIAMWEFYKINE